MFTACIATAQPGRGSAPASTGRAGVLALFAAAVLVAAPPAAAGPLKTGQPQARAAQVAPAEPVERLIIQYKATTKSNRAASASAAQDRATASAQVANTAGQAGVNGLRYVRSVAPQLHVARLDQPLPADQVQALVQRLRADPAVAAVEVDRRVRAHAVPTDPYLSPLFSSPYHQWHLQSNAQEAGGINAAAAWASSTGTGVVVAVLDGGYRAHRDLTNNLLTPGYDFVRADSDGSFWTANDGNGPDTDAQDPGDWIPRADAARCPDGEERSSWHGTHVAGLLAATANNVEGVGVAPGAQVLPVRVLGRCGGYISDVLAGARWAAGLSPDVGVPAPIGAAKVLNLSLGVGGSCDPISQSVVDEIRERGVSIVASAGNDGATTITAPANCKGVLAVTAHTRNGANAPYANVGAGVAISAPGGDLNNPVMSTWNDGWQTPGGDVYGGLYGTSMATPQVVGTLALMAAVRPELPLHSLELLLLGAARSFPVGDYCHDHPGDCGSGQLDAGAAVAAAVAADATLPDLELTQRTDAGTVTVGQPVAYTIEVRNRGGSAAGMDLQATVSSGLQLQSVTSSLPGVSLTWDATSFRVQLASLAAGETLSIGVTGRVTASGSQSSSAQVQASTAELSLVNNRDVLVLSGTVAASVAPPVAPVAPADGGGGCSVAPPGSRGDAGLPLLLTLALAVGLWRRVQRRAARAAQRPPATSDS